MTTSADHFNPFEHRSGKYEELGAEVGRLVDKKNKAYGNSFHQSAAYLMLLYPDGVRPDQYHDMLALVRDFDKSKRIATAKDAMGENPWADKAGYALLSLGVNPSPLQVK